MGPTGRSRSTRSQRTRLFIFSSDERREGFEARKNSCCHSFARKLSVPGVCCRVSQDADLQDEAESVVVCVDAMILSVSTEKSRSSKVPTVPGRWST